MNILRTSTGSARFQGSARCRLADEVIGRLRSKKPDAQLT